MALDQTTWLLPPVAGTSVTSAVSAPAPVAPAATTTPASSGGFSFHKLLADLNPLQYIPVVGAIYRAITGDQGNADLRFAVSLGTSFALGGPVGVGITLGEKVLGIDPEKIGKSLIASLFHKSPATPGAGTVAPAATTALAATDTPATSATGAGSARAWTAGELAAYGVSKDARGELAAGTITGSDVLNTLELHRLSATYA